MGIKCQINHDLFQERLDQGLFNSINQLPAYPGLPNHTWYKIGNTHHKYVSKYLALYSYRDVVIYFWFIYHGSHDVDGRPYLSGSFNHDFYSLDDILNCAIKYQDEEALNDLLFNLNIFAA